MFYGREDVFSFIQRNLIGRHRDTPIVLYGQRRTGKTSVLYQLHRHLGPGYRCIFIDLHGLNLQGMDNLLLGIASSINRSLRRDHQLTVEVPDRGAFLADPRSAFETMFLDRVWSALGEDHLVLMMDEVIRLDEEVRAGRLERDVFDYLRHLMQHYPRLNFIFSLGTRLSRLCGGGFRVFPGQPYGVDFFACRLVTARWLKSGGDQDAAELGGHVGGGRLGLAGVPGGAGAAGVDVGGGRPRGGGAHRGDGLAGELERDGALHGAGRPVAGLPGPEDLLAVFYRDLDAPPRCVALDDGGGAGARVGGDQGQVKAPG